VTATVVTVIASVSVFITSSPDSNSTLVAA
jgi:hypothetical protein